MILSKHSTRQSKLIETIMRVAVVLHGRIGVWLTGASGNLGGDVTRRLWVDNAPAEAQRAKRRLANGVEDAFTTPDLSPGSTISGFVRFLHSSFTTHVLEPNRAVGHAVEVFLHSWHPELRELLDALYHPMSSLHEPLVRSLIRPREKVRSQHLSMKRALALARAFSRSSGQNFDLIFVLRFDLIWFAPLLAPGLTHTRTQLWLPHWCFKQALTAAEGETVRAACGLSSPGGSGFLVSPPSALSLLGHSQNLSAGSKLDELLVLDWWFVARPRVAFSFSDVYDRYDDYWVQLNQIEGHGRMRAWAHFFWGFHIHHILQLHGAAIGFLLMEAEDFRLGRYWRLGVYCTPPQSHNPRGEAADAYARAGMISQEAPPDAPLPTRTCPATIQDTQHKSSMQGRALRCPWYTPVCSDCLRSRMLGTEWFVRTLMNETTRLPPKQLHDKRIMQRWQPSARVQEVCAGPW